MTYRVATLLTAKLQAVNAALKLIRDQGPKTEVSLEWPLIVLAREQSRLQRQLSTITGKEITDGP